MNSRETQFICPAVARRKLRGFSLVELVLVVSIMAIVAAMAVPRFANALTRNRVEAASRRVAADIALAQRHARLSSATQRVQFNDAGDSYRLPGLTHPDHPTQQYEVRLAEAPYEAALRDVVLDNNSELVFNAYGVPDTGGSLIVQCGEFARLISIDAAGRTTITDGPAAPAEQAMAAQAESEEQGSGLPAKVTGRAAAAAATQAASGH